MKKAASTRVTRDISPNPEVEAYLAAVPWPAQTLIRELRLVILAGVPAESVEVISYRVPAFSLGKPFFGYAAFKRHLAVLPFSGSTFDQFEEELANYTHTKSSLHLPFDRPLPIDLIRRLIHARVAILSKKK